MTVLVRLTRGYEAVIDDEDADRVLALKWQVHVVKNSVYAMHSHKIGGVIRKIPLHRYIMQPASGLVVDHIDGDGLNNARENLRVCTPRQNLRNARKSLNRKFPFKGVEQLPSGSYRARITIDYKSHSLGTFDTSEGAAKAYDAAAAKFFGDFAHLNFPNDIQPLEKRLAKDATLISGAEAAAPGPTLPTRFESVASVSPSVIQEINQ